MEPLEDSGQEIFFCGPPGKLQPGQLLALMVAPTPPTRTGEPRRTNLGIQKGKEASWLHESQGSWVTSQVLHQVGSSWVWEGHSSWDASPE